MNYCKACSGRGFLKNITITIAGETFRQLCNDCSATGVEAGVHLITPDRTLDTACGVMLHDPRFERSLDASEVTCPACLHTMARDVEESLKKECIHVAGRDPADCDVCSGRGIWDGIP